MTPTTKQYYAFISYKRDDQKWAEWLQEKLEHYKLPTNLNGRSDLPKEIRPVFRDKSELAAGVLADEIQKALDNSKYLIVICSPHSAKSEWVNKEVQAFIESGRTDKIIPFIIEGTPNSGKDETECFPKAIRELPAEDELLGVNINEMGRDAAAVKVVAQMFGLRFDDLWQRHEREQRRKRFMIIAAALLLALVGVGVAVGFSRQNKRISEQNDKIVLQNEEISKKSDEVSKQNAEISKKNEEIVAKSNEVSRQNDEIVKKNERLQNDSLIMAAQLDSINKRDKLITRQQDSIKNTNKNLKTAYEQLENERDNLAKTIWKMKEKESRVLAKEVMAWADEDSYAAKKVALEILPKNVNNPTDRPYTPEAEQALRTINDKKNVVFKYPSYVRFVSFGDDDRKIISATDDAVYVTDSYDGMELLKKDFHNIRRTEISADKQQIAVAHDSLIEIIEVKTGEILQTINVKSKIFDIAFSSNGNKIVSMSADSLLRVWDAKTGNVLFYKKAVHPVDRRIKMVTFSPDGKQFAYVECEDKSGRANSYGAYFYELDYEDSKDVISKLFIYSKNTFYVVDSESGVVLCSWTGHRRLISSLAYNPDGKNIVTTSHDRDIIVWDAENGKKLNTMKWENNSVAISAYFTNDNKKLVTAHGSGYIKVWDVDTGEEIKSWKAHIRMVNSIALNSDDGKVISGSDDATLKIWNTKDNTEIIARISNYDRVFIGKDKKTIYSLTQRGFRNATFGAFTIEDGKENIIDNDPSYTGYINIDDYFGDVFYHDLNYFITLGVPINQYKMNVYDLNTKKLVCTLKGHEDDIDHVSVSPDGKKMLSHSEDGMTIIWDLETGNEIKRFDKQFIGHCYYCPDMKKIAVMYNNRIIIKDAESFNTIMTFNEHSTTVQNIRFVSDTVVASYDANSTKLWNLETGKMLHGFKGIMWAKNTTISSDGKYFITQVDKETLCVWDMSTDGCVYSVKVDREKYGYIEDYAFTNDGKHIIVVLSDFLDATIFIRKHHHGVIRQYDFPPLQDLIDQTRERFKNRPLTDEERKMYYLE